MLQSHHRRSLRRATNLYLANDLDGCERVLRALFVEIGAAAGSRDRRTLGEGWECLARIEIDRGDHERAMDAFKHAEQALAVDSDNRELLGRVEYQLATEFHDLPGFESEARKYFERARENLAGSEE